MRKLPANEPQLIGLQNRYKAVNIRILITMLAHRRSVKLKLLNGGDVKTFL